MVRDIFLEIGEDQKQFQHAVAEFKVGFGGLIVEIIDNCQRVGQQPFEFGGVDGAAVAAKPQCVIGAEKRFVEKMVQTEALDVQSRRDRIGASNSPAPTGDRSCHNVSPRILNKTPKLSRKATTEATVAHQLPNQKLSLVAKKLRRSAGYP
jgi:hypothetical protein